MAAPADVTVGIDVAQARLDVAVQPTGTTWTVARARGGRRRLPGQLEARRPTPHRAGSQRWRRAGRGRRPERRWPASRRRQSAPDARRRPRPRHPGQDRPAGRARAGAVRGRGAAPAAAPTQRRRPGPPAPQPPPAPPGRGPRGRAAAAPPRPGPPGPGLRPPGRRADRGPRASRPPAGGPGAGGARAARARRLAAEHPRDRARGRHRLAGRSARTRDLLPPAGRRPRRGRALQPRQRRLARAPELLGRGAPRSAPRSPWPP